MTVGVNDQLTSLEPTSFGAPDLESSGKVDVGPLAKGIGPQTDTSKSKIKKS